MSVAFQLLIKSNFPTVSLHSHPNLISY